MSPHQARAAADQLNRECFCVTLDQQALANALQHEVADADFFAALTVSHPHLFSHAPVLIAIMAGSLILSFGFWAAAWVSTRRQGGSRHAEL